MTTPATGTDPDANPELSRVTAIDLAERMLAIYTSVETRLAAGIASRLRAGMQSPQWAQNKLNAVGELRRWSRILLDRANRETDDEITQAMLLAYMRGGEEAMRTIAAMSDTLPEWLNLAGIDDPSPTIRAALAASGKTRATKLAAIARAYPGIGNLMHIIKSLVYKIRGTNLPVLRWTEDVYRETIAAGALPDVTLGLATRRRASQTAWESLLAQGVSGFEDRAGRQWNLATYVEMATRSGVVQAAIEGHLDRLADAGIDYVQVSNHTQECERCRPWEGKILARTGPPGARVVMLEHATRDGEMVAVSVAGTVAEAILAGFMHPNCRHSLNAYFPGVTKPVYHTEDPEGDKARQRLRYLERKVRKEKLLAEAAIDPAAAKVHAGKARGWQAKIRDHVKENAHRNLKRKPEREKIDLGNRVKETAITDVVEPPAKPKPAKVKREPQTETLPLPEPAGEPVSVQADPVPPPLPPVTDGELQTMSDDELGERFALVSAAEDADEAEMLRLLAEMDRREEPAKEPDWLDSPNAEAFGVDIEQTPEQERLDQLLAQGVSFEEAYAEVHGLDEAELTRQAAASTVDRRPGETLDQATRRSYDEWVHVRYLQAEEATRGNVLNREGQATNVDPVSLFSGPLARARKYASEELLRWWTDNDRLDYTAFKAQVLRRDKDIQAAEKTRSRSNDKDFI
jgi:hypothetical protein